MDLWKEIKETVGLGLSLNIIADISHHYTNFILIYEHTYINKDSLKMHVRHYYY